MAALGSVVVELSANIAKFQSDFGRAAAIAESRAKEIDKSLSIVKTSLSVLGAGFLANATFDKIKEKILGAIESAAGLKELSERTGVAAGQLSGLNAVAKLSGTDSEVLATGLQKLSKSMVDAASGGAKTTAALNSIGISADGIDKQKPDQVFLRVAQQLDKYADGANKTAIAQQLFGKAGANLLPVLRDLAIAGEIQVKTTEEQAAAAQAYERGLKALQLSTNAVYKVIALEAVPAMSSFVQALLGAQKEAGGLSDQVKKLAKDGSLRDFFENAAIYAAKFIDVLVTVKNEFAVVFAGFNAARALVSGPLLAFGTKDQVANNKPYQDAVKERERTAKEFEAATSKFLSNGDTYEQRLRKQFASDRANPPKPEQARPDANFSGNLEKAAKVATDDPSKKILEGKLKQQEGFIASAKKLADEYQRDLDFYVQQQYITEAASLDIKKTVIEQELAQEHKFYAQQLADIDSFLKGKISAVDRADRLNKRADVLRKQVADEEDARNKIKKILEDKGALQRNFDLGTADVARQQNLANESARFQIDLLGRTTLEVQQLTAARQIQLALEERIRQARLKDENTDVTGAVQKSFEEQTAAAKLIQESYEKQRTGAFGASEAVRKYGEDSSNTASQIEATMSNAFKGAEDAFVQFTTTGKTSFRSLAQSILADIERILIKKAIAGIIDFAVGAFSPSGGGITAGSGSGFSNTGFDIQGRHARGGSVGTYGNYLVGEEGPEILRMGGASGSIVPNDKIGGGGNVTVINNFNGDGSSSTKASGDGAEARRFGELIGNKVREVILTEKRAGGLLTV